MYFSIQLWEINVVHLQTESSRSSGNKWTKIQYQDYLHRVANFCVTVLNTFSKEIIPSNTKRRKGMFNFSHETPESTGEMKLMMKFCLCSHTFSELCNLFSLISMGNCFRCYCRDILTYLALRKCKNDCKIQIILVLIFVH